MSNRLAQAEIIKHLLFMWQLIKVVGMMSLVDCRIS